jgi:DNA-binding LacI/PurR family transcriptional regulator
MVSATPDAGARVLEDLVEGSPDVSAIVTMNSPATAGILAAAANHGLRVPQDLALVALLTAARAAELFSPPLTTVTPSTAFLGELAVDVLIDELEGRSRPLQRMVPGELTVRASSGACRR